MPYTHYGGLPPHVSADTSTQAAIGILAHVDNLRERVRRYVELCGDHGATTDEIEAATGMIHQTASARTRELEQDGELLITQERRPTRSGRKARVYVVRGKPAVQLELPT